MAGIDKILSVFDKQSRLQWREIGATVFSLILVSVVGRLQPARARDMRRRLILTGIASAPVLCVFPAHPPHPFFPLR